METRSLAAGSECVEGLRFGMYMYMGGLEWAGED